jgi:hypothetical protein
MKYTQNSCRSKCIIIIYMLAVVIYIFITKPVCKKSHIGDVARVRVNRLFDSKKKVETPTTSLLSLKSVMKLPPTQLLWLLPNVYATKYRILAQFDLLLFSLLAFYIV